MKDVLKFSHEVDIDFRINSIVIMTTFSSASLKAQLKQSLDEALVNATDIKNNLSTLAHGAVLGVTNSKDTVYLNASGQTEMENPKPLRSDAKIAWFSCTKAVTTTALLILVTQKKITLDDPITKFYPEFDSIKVMENDEPRAPKKPVTLRQLLTHTAGFTYQCILSMLGSVAEEPGQDPNQQALEDCFLSFEPGTKFAYGLGIDWAGFILEHISGMTLGEFIKKYIFDPLDIKDTAFSRAKDEENLLVILSRAEDGGFKRSRFLRNYKMPRDMGGQGLYGTVSDFLKFIRLWLNEGRAPNGQQLFAHELFEEAIKNQLPDGVELQFEEALLPELSRPIPNAPFGIVDSWGLGFARTEGKSPTGRPVGTLYWCGMANLYFWIDLKNKFGGLYATQILPMLDDSAQHFMTIEKRIYDVLEKEKTSEAKF